MCSLWRELLIHSWPASPALDPTSRKISHSPFRWPIPARWCHGNREKENMWSSTSAHCILCHQRRILLQSFLGCALYSSEPLPVSISRSYTELTVAVIHSPRRLCCSLSSETIASQGWIREGNMERQGLGPFLGKHTHYPRLFRMLVLRPRNSACLENLWLAWFAFSSVLTTRSSVP